MSEQSQNARWVLALALGVPAAVLLGWTIRARSAAAIDAQREALAAVERWGGAPQPVESTAGAIGSAAKAVGSAADPLRMANHHTAGTALTGASAATSSPRAITVEEALDLARKALDELDRELHFYTGRLIRRERLADELQPETEMEFKIQTRLRDGERVVRPLGVYLKFVRPQANEGREVIWVEGQNDNKLIAHEAGLMNVMRANLDIKGWLAMRGMRYSIDQIGLQNLLEQLLMRGSEAAGQPGVRAQLTGGQQVGGRTCTLLEVTQPEPVPGARFHIARIFMDDERQIPLLYESFLWPLQPGGPPELDEQYTYLDVQLNPPVDPRAFDPDNPAYNYP